MEIQTTLPNGNPGHVIKVDHLEISGQVKDINNIPVLNGYVFIFEDREYVVGDGLICAIIDLKLARQAKDNLHRSGQVNATTCLESNPLNLIRTELQNTIDSVNQASGVA